MSKSQRRGSIHNTLPILFRPSPEIDEVGRFHRYGMLNDSRVLLGLQCSSPGPRLLSLIVIHSQFRCRTSVSVNTSSLAPPTHSARQNCVNYSDIYRVSGALTARQLSRNPCSNATSQCNTLIYHVGMSASCYARITAAESFFSFSSFSLPSIIDGRRGCH